MHQKVHTEEQPFLSVFHLWQTPYPRFRSKSTLSNNILQGAGPSRVLFAITQLMACVVAKRHTKFQHKDSSDVDQQMEVTSG